MSEREREVKMKGALQGEAVAPVVVYGGGPISWRKGRCVISDEKP